MQDAAAFGEGSCHRLLEPGSVLRPAFIRVSFRPVLLRESWATAGLAASNGSRSKGWSGNTRLSQTRKKVGEVGIGNRIVVGRVGEPDPGGLVGEWVVGGVVGRLNLATRSLDAGHRRDRPCKDVQPIAEAARRIAQWKRLAESPHAIGRACLANRCSTFS